MATSTRGKKERPFPALVIASLLFLACLYPGQYLIAHLLPGISGQATINPSLIIFDIPIHLPVTIDLILVAALFFLVYAGVILVFPSGRGGTRYREIIPRLGAVLAGSFFFLFASASGALISDLVHDHLPRNVRNGIDSLGIAADVSLPFSGTIHLPGNFITLLGLIIGFAIVVAKIGTDPGKRKTAPLTREQRMTPYQRMQQEKKLAATGKQSSTTAKQPAVTSKAPAPAQKQLAATGKAPAQKQATSVKPATAAPKSSVKQSTIRPNAVKPLCTSQPLYTLEPEAVAYMPMG
ncbi:MAG TPA: hypothetical protein VGS79_13300 [Puia sp.]|nr:hypothetical protein [Puia sp.]